MELSFQSEKYDQEMFLLTSWGDQSMCDQCHNGSLDTLGNTLEYAGSMMNKYSEDDWQFWSAARQFLFIAYLCRWEDHIVLSSEDKVVDKKLIVEKFEKFIEYYKIIGKSSFVYNKSEQRYVVVIARLPVFSTPESPFEITLIPQREMPFFTRDFFDFIDREGTFFNRLLKL